MPQTWILREDFHSPCISLRVPACLDLDRSHLFSFSTRPGPKSASFQSSPSPGPVLTSNSSHCPSSSGSFSSFLIFVLDASWLQLACASTITFATVPLTCLFCYSPPDCRASNLPNCQTHIPTHPQTKILSTTIVLCQTLRIRQSFYYPAEPATYFVQESKEQELDLGPI